MLAVINMTIRSDTRTVVRDVSLDVPAGNIVALLGPNGAGKSELVLGIAGAIPASGTVCVDGKIVKNGSIQERRSAGIAAIPEGHQILTGLTVKDNLKAAGPLLSDKELAIEIEHAHEIFPELTKLGDQVAGSLSGGQQQMLAIAQGLISRPKFLLLDEMSLGLAPVIIDRLLGVITELRTQNIGVLLIEQFTQLALEISDHCYVMAQGKLQYSGSPAKLKNNPEVLERAYLGSR